MPKRYDSILFDLGKVLIPFDFSRAYNLFGDATGFSVLEIRSRLAATDLFVRFETGSITPEEFADTVSTLFAATFSYREFCAIWNSIFLPEPLLPESLIIGLRRNHCTFIVSNTNAIHFKMLKETYPILSQFDGYVLSYEIHSMKPASEFYSAALRISGSSPNRTLFIDDLAENVEGARLAGMDAIVFQSREQLENELAVRGLNTRV